MKKFANMFKRSKPVEESVIYGHAPDVIDLDPSQWRNLGTQPIPERKARKFTPSKEQQL